MVCYILQYVLLHVVGQYLHEVNKSSNETMALNFLWILLQKYWQFWPI